ncbi:M1 family metallopeptidase [Sphingomonas abietis]|uniref:Aminopeptidase n=1 Tax=Sphingomonas abietis TaxID=3012344 RepID=A0ABY7NUE2_9SPHN|nr:M1 family metallopeptidase [Sphingomonas abietis]WBO24253.1 M1 family metallopeptidase [Sphingomonas abietis]
MRRASLLLATATGVLALAAPAIAQTTPAPVALHQAQLPRTVTPTRYDIAVTPDAEKMVFTGSVKIAIDIHAATRTITLNALELTIDRASLAGAGTPTIAYDPELQTVTLTFAKPLAAGRYTLDLAYHGKINRSSQGLFALDYDTPQGKKRMLATQFEAADARRFVPSFDEPDLKAVFGLTVTAPKDQFAVSNMPIAQQTDIGGGLSRVTFQPSPKMSSYLMYLGIGDMQRIHEDVDGVDVGVIVRRGATDQAHYALDAAAHILRFYNDYFGIKFPLPKLDLIGGPGSGGFGAMENWGAIFYFESDLLVDPKTATDADKQNVYLVIAHEMAHQWFGDLVTMGWWDDLWLNEGFASWMENKATDSIHPEWHVWLQFAAGRDSAFSTDALTSTHPVVEPADTIDQVNRIGDAITYEKGAAVIRMIEAYAGQDDFRTGIRRYLAAHAYGNATTAELFQTIQAASGKPIVKIGDDFTQQSGVPLIKESDAGGSVSLTQGRFGLDAASRQPRRWTVPVIAAPLGQAATDQAAEQRVAVTGTDPVALNAGGAAPLIVNAGQTGYFRTQYAKSQLARLAAAFGQVPAADQLGLLSDTWALAASGDGDPADFLDLTGKLPLSADPTVWDRLSDQLRTIDGIYAPGPQRDAFRAYARALLAPEFATLGFDAKPGESDNAGVLRNSLIQTLGRFGDAGVIAEARRRFEAHAADPASAGGPTMRAVIAVAAEHADQATFDQLRKLAAAATDSLQKQHLDFALATVADPAILQQALALTLTDEVPTTSGPRMLYVAAQANPDLTWTFATEHRPYFESRLDSLQRYQLYARIASPSPDLARADQLQAFAEKYIPASARRDVLKAQDAIRTRARLRTAVLPQIDQWVAKR